MYAQTIFNFHCRVQWCCLTRLISQTAARAKHVNLKLVARMVKTRRSQRDVVTNLQEVSLIVSRTPRWSEFCTDSWTAEPLAPAGETIWCVHSATLVIFKAFTLLNHCNSANLNTQCAVQCEGEMSSLPKKKKKGQLLGTSNDNKSEQMWCISENLQWDYNRQD